MREQTWNERHPHTEHYRWFQDLMDLHALTQSWFRELNIDQGSEEYQFKRVSAPDVKKNLRILSNLTQSSVPSDFETYLDDSYPEEFLARLEQTVWIVQAWSLKSILEKTPKKEVSALLNVLEKSSWKAGQVCLRKRWPDLAKKKETDIRVLVALFQDSPFSGFPGRRAFLIRRAVTDELSVHLLACPHQKKYLEVQATADELCRLHHHWMHGFAYGVNHQIAAEYTSHTPSKIKKNAPVDQSQKDIMRPYCIQRWFYHQSTPSP